MSVKIQNKTNINSNTAIIIPVYNEGKVIKDVLEQLLKSFNSVVCVNDGSKDNSSSEILKTRAYIIEHPINMGQGSALQTGIEFATQLEVDYFVTFDADGQHKMEDVQEMLKIIESTKKDIVLGSRFIGKTIGMKSTKKHILRLATYFTNITSGLKLTDTNNGLRVFNRKVAEEMQITLPDMAHASEIIEIIAKKKYTYIEAPATIEYTDYSLNKGQPIINAVNIAFDTILRKITK